MPRKPPKPYYTDTPWEGFTPREHKREHVLKRCPSDACHRAKACVMAHDSLYCRRTHMSVEDVKARVRALEPDDGFEPPLKRSQTQIEVDHIIAEMRAKDAELRHLEMTLRWKRGDFDDLYGKWSKRGALKQPPVRQYTE
jgi:hypothetical protein